MNSIAVGVTHGKRTKDILTLKGSNSYLEIVRPFQGPLFSARLTLGYTHGY